jgi:hypothetical protein
MDEQAVRAEARVVCDAIVAGDMGPVIEHLSKELRQNIGEVVSLMPLPASAATIQSAELGGSSWNVTIAITGESEEVVIQTRWKERDDRPTIIEASHLRRVEMAAPADDGEANGEDESTA